MSQSVGMMCRRLKDRRVPKRAKLPIHMTILGPPIQLYHCCRCESAEIGKGINKKSQMM